MSARLESLAFCLPDGESEIVAVEQERGMRENVLNSYSFGYCSFVSLVKHR